MTKPLIGLVMTLALVGMAKPLAAAPTTKPAEGKELAVDDGKSAGQKSIAGSGHGVAFEAADAGPQVTAVKIYGSRYGTPAPPAESFTVTLCDLEGKEIKEFKFPYKVFTRGDAKWVTLTTEPTNVPRRFIVYVAFNPEPTKGVYVHFDAKKDGDSRQGVPGDDQPFEKGDWMIRAVIAAK